MGTLPPLISALLQPGAYPHPVRALRLVQTHISYVLLTGPFAYKIKKPLDLGFLDYTTLPKRRRFCQQEVLLNSRLCPNIYLGVVEIRENGGEVAIMAVGRVLEYAVKMVQLPAERMMDRLLDGGKIDGPAIDRVARRVAAFHQEAASGPEIGRYGERGWILTNVSENFAQTQAYIGRTIDEAVLDRIQAYSYAFLDQNQETFQSRIAGRRIRDCHGDLRSENICLTDGVCIFDCIEFNDRFRYADVAAEVAFLAMDLDYRGRPDLSRRFVASYVDYTGDHGLLALLDFYKCYRAYVRGKVESFKLDESDIPEPEKRIALLAAPRYFALADSYTTRQEKLAASY
ncbi:MAG: phosphotransferase [Chloroflexi bacterium]|nr:phosphotransferase [Chloroflexota bacterium]